MPGQVIRVALAVPLRQFFDYTAPANAVVAPGVRVRVPFGRSSQIGLVTAVGEPPGCPAERLKPVETILDAEPLLGADQLAFMQWAANYYHHPVGEVMAAALPLRLRKQNDALPLEEPGWRLTDEGRAQLADPPRRAPRQAGLLGWFGLQPGCTAARSLVRAAFPNCDGSLRSMQQKHWIVACSIPAAIESVDPHAEQLTASGAQTEAIAAVAKSAECFSVSLLDGVTGSGKTEVYLRLAAQAVAAGKSVLVLVPEISLTPQLFKRFRARLGATVRTLHSGFTDNEREQTWHRVRLGLSRVLLGTRSAVFTPMPELGLVIVDEEHDASFKQAEGFRYSARDLAVMRAQRAGCPVVLGSATPSLESLRHARSGRYRHLRLDHRAGGAVAPTVNLLDLRDQPLTCGLSAPMIERIASTLAAGEQAMLFLNRRGFAPVLSCFACGWVSDCPHCDAHQTLHRRSGLLWCHHCGARRRAPTRCPACDSADINPLGQGTEQLEDYLLTRFPDVPLIRIDRDATARKGSLERLLAQLSEPGPALLVGTQMLAKGHHFPRVTLVGVVDADGGLYSADFRATERLAQLLVQVAGRAGRGTRPGQVLIQTRFPDHPLLRTLVRDGYRAFASAALTEREAAQLPPFSHQALLRADAREMDQAQAFLEQAAGVVQRHQRSDPSGVEVWGPVPAPMARRGGRQRAQLLFQAAQRDRLHHALHAFADQVHTLPNANRVRWSLDVDPVDLF